MPYDAWTKIDSGREGLWKNKVWLGALQIIAKHEGADVYDPAAAVYAELEAKLPGVGWMKQDNGAPRPLFRDYAKPWTATGVLSLTDQKFQLTALGRQVASGALSPHDFFQGFIERWIEDGERPFTQLAGAFLEVDEALNLRDLYFGVMRGYRIGDDAVASIQNARNMTDAMEETPKRRLIILLSIMEAAGAIAREELKASDADTKWIVWNTDLLKKVASVGGGFVASGDAPRVDLESIPSEFDLTTKAAGLAYDKTLILRLVGGIFTKKFCILTGLAGSGKTKIAEAFAMWICASPMQYRIVAVGADWTSNENLLGYADALQTGVYRPPVNGALELILRASADQANPYFLILDEMNLSHVERYFADFLSAMESANAPLSLHGVAAGLQAGGVPVPSSLVLPNNLFIIGTVNVDETTYMFSPKVLDRANVIEFRATPTQMADFLNAPAAIDLVGLGSQGTSFAAAFVQRANAEADVATLVDAAGTALAPKLKADLLEVFGALADIGAEFGFRTAKEIARFMVIHKELSGTAWDYKNALDAQVVQKLMPKLHGSARKLDGVLKALATFAAMHDLALTGEKVKRMQQRLNRDGFTSFAEA